ncbi:S8 family serine peptidase [Streptomyces monticola]|uniref:S8 family serine peptidase n=1 Tax=Streptomyces monticola TaxID=2666263 RepID=A0ABW2JB42_9ACTN
MTASISNARQRRHSSRPLRRGLLAVGAALGAWTIALSGTAPAAAADDVQSKQWYLDLLYAKKVWEKSTGKGIKVAVIDSGVNPNTPSLKGQVLKGVDATVEKGGNTNDTNGQGTTTAELIAGTGKGGGLQGLAPGAKIIPFRVPLLKHDQLPPGTWIERDPLYHAIRAAADSDAQIIALNVRNEHAIGVNLHADSAVDYASSKGKLVIAGTGDNAKEGNKRQYPASQRLVAGVASVDRKGKVAKTSQHGDYVDLAAPGVDIPRWCDASFKRYCDGGGTSAATAIASASAALVWSAHPEWNANQVLRVLFQTAGRTWKDGDRSKYLGHGVVRPVVNVANGKGNPGTADINPLTDVDPAESKSPSPTDSASSQQAKGQEKGGAASAEGDEKTNNSQLGLIAGIAAAVAALAAGAVALARKRRNA